MILGSRAAGRRSKADANIVAMLSLKLLLLAFFILLATMSRFEEERTRAVMESVTTTFRGQVTAVVNSGAPEAGLGLKDRQANLRRGIEALFRQTLPAVEVETSADGRLLRVETPASALFADGKAELIAQRGALLRRLANALSQPASAPETYELEVLHAVASDAAVDAARLPVARAGALVRHLEGLGLPRARLAAGVWPTAGDAERVAFEVRLPPRPAPAHALDDGGSAAGETRP